MPSGFVSTDHIRSLFRSDVADVPDGSAAYGTLMELVGQVNAEALAADPELRARLKTRR